MIKQLTKLANHLDAKGLRIEAEALEQVMIRLAQTGDTPTDDKLDELGLERDHLIERGGDPYKYIWVPEDSLFLVVEYHGSKERGGFDENGYAERDITIREGEGGFDILIEEIRPLGLIKEHQQEFPPPLRAFESGGWTQYRNPDNTIAYYIDDARVTLERIDSRTTISGSPIGQVGSRPKSPNIWTPITH